MCTCELVVAAVVVVVEEVAVEARVCVCVSVSVYVCGVYGGGGSVVVQMVDCHTYCIVR